MSRLPWPAQLEGVWCAGPPGSGSMFVDDVFHCYCHAASASSPAGTSQEQPAVYVVILGAMPHRGGCATQEAEVLRTTRRTSYYLSLTGLQRVAYALHITNICVRGTARIGCWIIIYIEILIKAVPGSASRSGNNPSVLVCSAFGCPKSFSSTLF